MAPQSRVILCRHSQAEHNVDLDYSIPDAPLTALGKKQSGALAPQIPQLQQEVDLIITSALKRTLQSTKLGWGPAIDRLGIKNVICLPQAQESNDFPCDTGSSREHLESLDEFKDFNLELLTPDWNSKKGFYAPAPQSTAKRAQWVRKYIKEREEKTIVLVAHGDILRQITGTAAGPSTYQWKNAEVREYFFDAAYLHRDESFLVQKDKVAVAGGYEATSSEMDITQHESTNPGAGPSMAPAAQSTSTGGLAATKSETNGMTASASQEMDELNEEEDNSSTSGEMLDPAKVAQDPNIFTPNGRIIFPRSDGDPNYGPPNTEVPRPNDPEVNYFHIFTREENKWVTWSKMIALKLATDYFGLPPLAPNGKDWALADYPKDYYMTEQRKGPRRNIRTDPYLFGSAAHRFRSTPEFMPHAYWLLVDPTMNPANCACRYCTPGGRAKNMPASGSSSKAAKAAKQANKTCGAGLTAAKSITFRGKNNYRIRAQASPREHQLPGVPLAIHSNEDRVHELAAVETKEFGPCEGFRIGEVAYCTLMAPISNPDQPGDEDMTIKAWPVLIDNVTLQVDVDPAASSRNAAFSLEGRVKQRRTYDVVFVQTHEKARVEQERLFPALMFRLPTKLKEVKLGSTKDHPWIENKTLVPDLQLESSNRTHNLTFAQTVFCYLYAVESCKMLRLFYMATDAFSRMELGRKAVENVVSVDGSAVDTAKKLAAASTETAPWLSNGAAPQQQSAPGNRFLEVTERNNYMDLDDDDSSSRRRRGAQIQKSGDSTTSSALQGKNGITGMGISPLDNNTYWQGLFFCLERVWVGDLVRLRLGQEDVETMMASLARGNDLHYAADRGNLRPSNAYVLRVKAIYRPAKVEVERTDDKIRVAGDVFRVVDLEEEMQGKARAGELKASGEGGTQKDDLDVGVIIGGDAPSITKKSANTNDHNGTASSSFEIPFRPFLDRAYENRLPMTPSLPPGFGFQRVNRSSVEVVCSVSQLAGRLWCSFAQSGDAMVAKAERHKVCLAHEDSRDPTRIRLSLSGMIAGAAKAMEVHANEGYYLNRDRAIAQASKLALGARINGLTTQLRKGDEEADRVADALIQEAHQANEQQRQPSVQVDQDRDVAPESEREAKKPRLERSESSTSTTRVLNGGSIKSETLSKEQIAELAKQVTLKQAEEALALQQAAAAQKEAPPREASPPLPPNWIKKASRKGQGTYYANIKTKQTSWDRPTA